MSPPHAQLPQSVCKLKRDRKEIMAKGKEKQKDKSKEKPKEKKDKKAKASKTTASVKTTAPSGSDMAGYTDGTPLDRVQYLEAKLILKPDNFTSVQAFRDFGKLVERTAKKVGVGFIEDREASLRPQIREIIFGDTPDFRLYNNAFILRRRVSYVDGFPVGDPEVVFKFRHPDEKQATAVDVRPKIAGKYRIKFKAEVLPLKDQVGGYRILYSHNCQFGVSQVHEANRSMATLIKVFPALAALKKSDEEQITLVNEGIVEEVLLPLGQLDFGKGIVAKCDIGLWRTRGEHKSLVGEFAFQAKFDRREDVAEKQKKLVAQFYVTLQRDVENWLALGVTKTGMVYRLKGNEPQSHE
jgi:hypothetical protein